MRRQNGGPKTKDWHSLDEQAKANSKSPTRSKLEYFVDEDERTRLKSLPDDLAFVCPLIDGRLKDIAEGK